MAYEDLLKDTSVQSSDPGYFIVTITDLDPLKLYPLQLRWKYNDNTFGPWSAVKSITTPSETVPPTPNLGVSDVVGGNGYIKITWDGKDDFGDRIGKGVYVYKLTVKSTLSNKKAEKIEKLVIL